MRAYPYPRLLNAKAPLSLRHDREAGPVVAALETRRLAPDRRPGWGVRDPLPVTGYEYPEVVAGRFG